MIPKVRTVVLVVHHVVAGSSILTRKDKRVHLVGLRNGGAKKGFILWEVDPAILFCLFPC
jgi:hypothetical protein